MQCNAHSVKLLLLLCAVVLEAYYLHSHRPVVVLALTDHSKPSLTDHGLKVNLNAVMGQAQLLQRRLSNEFLIYSELAHVLSDLQDDIFYVLCKESLRSMVYKGQ